MHAERLWVAKLRTAADETPSDMTVLCGAEGFKGAQLGTHYAERCQPIGVILYSLPLEGMS